MRFLKKYGVSICYVFGSQKDKPAIAESYLIRALVYNRNEKLY